MMYGMPSNLNEFESDWISLKLEALSLSGSDSELYPHSELLFCWMDFDSKMADIKLLLGLGWIRPALALLGLE